MHLVVYLLVNSISKSVYTATFTKKIDTIVLSTHELCAQHEIMLISVTNAYIVYARR
jgi:hypothetical protein